MRLAQTLQAPEPERPALQLVPQRPIRDAVEFCRYIIEKTCDESCRRCQGLLADQVTKPIIRLPRRWGGATEAVCWAAQHHARLFDTVEEAQAVIDDLELIHAVIVDRCHPWNRG